MKLSKRIPARTKTVEFLWIKRDFTVMSDRYRRIRKAAGAPLDKCFWCGHLFSDGEKIALSRPDGPGANKVLCMSCADAAVSH